jgi:hypothetical protein
LTDLDWSPEIWIACHDDDEQCSRLAHHIWDENGFDVPEDFAKDLLLLLGSWKRPTEVDLCLTRTM